MMVDGFQDDWDLATPRAACHQGYSFHGRQLHHWKSHLFPKWPPSSDWSTLGERPCPSSKLEQLCRVVPVSLLPGGWWRLALGLHCSSASPSIQGCLLPCPTKGADLKNTSLSATSRLSTASESASQGTCFVTTNDNEDGLEFYDSTCHNLEGKTTGLWAKLGLQHWFV